MKNTILGLFGGVMIIFLSLIGISAYSQQIRQNELENHVSRIVKNTLEQNYAPYLELQGKQKSSSESIKRQLEFDLRKVLTTNSDIEITIKACDLEKGILSVAVEEQFLYPNGKEGSVLVERTAIIDRMENTYEE